MRVPFEIDLKNMVAVLTGAGGVLCSLFAEAMAACGAKVALLDLNEAAAKAAARKITAEGGVAKGYAYNVLDKESLAACHSRVLAELGSCDILLNGAGGDSPKAATDKDTYQPGDIDADTKCFFDLDADGVNYVFNLNYLGTLLWLLSDEASGFVTGVVVPVDGGFSAYSGGCSHARIHG